VIESQRRSLGSGARSAMRILSEVLMSSGRD
jgi:hypothetical protein